MKRTLVLVCALALLAPELFAKASMTAITGGTVISVNGDAPVEDAVILIEGNRIKRLGRAGQVKIPKEARRIDAKGKWIIPGLIDAHVHFFQSGGLYTRPDVVDLRKRVPYADHEMEKIHANLQSTFARYLRSGITSVADVGGPFWNFEVREAAKSSPAAPRVFVAGPLISTVQPEELTTNDPPILGVNNPGEATALVRREAERKPDFVKIWYIVKPGETAQQSFELVRAAIEEAHRLGLRSAVHATEFETAKLAVQAGADILVHSVEDKDVDEEFVDLLKRNKVIYTPTLGVFEGYMKTFSQQVRLTSPDYRWADPFVVSTLFDLQHIPAQELPGGLVQLMANPQPLEPPAAALRNLKRLHDAGVIIAAGSDAGNIGTLPGPALFRELEMMTDAGLTPIQVLACATRGGAKLLGQEKELGSIERGKLADLVLLNSDPTRDIRNASDIHAVMKDGQFFEAAAILKRTPADVVQHQVNAYNARNLEAFAETYHPEVSLFKFPNELLSSGMEKLRADYGALFKDTPKLHVEIKNRMVAGRYVVDEERVTGLPGGRMLEALAIYEVQDGLIRNVWLVYK